MSIDGKIRKQLDFFEKALDPKTGLLRVWDLNNKEWIKPYPEVTGYTIPTIINASNRLFYEKGFQIAKTMLEFLLKIQDIHGGYGSFYGNYLYSFDTLAVAEGMLAGYKEFGDERYLKCAQKCCEFVKDMQHSSGAFYFMKDISGNKLNANCMWNSGFSGMFTKFMPTLLELGCKDIALGYINWLKNMLLGFRDKELYSTWPECSISFSHPMGYMLEGLLKLEHSAWDIEIEDTKNIIENNILPCIKNGFIPFVVTKYSPSDYSYVSGCTQYSYILAMLYRVFDNLKFKEIAKECLSYFELCEKTSGIYGGSAQFCNKDGSLAGIPPLQVNTWASKFYIDTLLELYPRWNWHKTSQMYLDNILNLMDVKDRNIIEVGSATGHISLALAQEGANLTLLDLNKSIFKQAKTIWDQYNVNFIPIIADIRNFKSEKKYDIAFNSGVIQQYSNENEQIEILKSIKNLLSTGGIYICFIPDTNHSSFRTSMYKNEHCPSDLIPLFQKAGFKNIKQKRILAEEVTEPYDFIMIIGQANKYRDPANLVFKK